ncbi:MAG: Crp/Fnr family transcriptional regulator [Ruminococcaceae bacterium]|nr:Crp/Fnr family transcriptional regulator [Oscillospiraceae bacterium]
MKKYFDILKKCPLFWDVREEDIVPLLSCLGARTELFDKRYTVFAEGSPAKYVGIVLSGAVQMERVDYMGNRSIVLSAEPSELFCEAFACSQIQSIPVSVVAAKESEIMFIDCHRMMHSCEHSCSFHHQMIFNLMKNLAEKNVLFHQKLDVTSKRTTREKLLTYLDFQSKKSGGREFSIPFDRQELADYLEVDRSGLSSEIGKLKKEGILDSEKNRFVLL